MQGPAYPISTEFTALLSKPLHHSLIWDIRRKSEHLPLCGIQLVLNTEPHRNGRCYAAGCCCQWVYPDACSWPLHVAFERSDSNSLHWLCYYVKSKSRDHMMSKNSNFTGECLWLVFLQPEWNGVSPLHACWFSHRHKMVSPCSIAHHNLLHICIILSTGTVHAIIQDLGYRKVCSLRSPIYQLTDTASHAIITRCDGNILLHKNAWPHVAQRVQDQPNSIQWEVLKQPTYTPDTLPMIFTSLDD